MPAPQPSLQLLPLRGSLETCLARFREHGFSLLSAEELVLARYGGNFLHDGLVVAENYNYFPDGIRVARREHNPLLRNVHRATAAHRFSQTEFYLDSIAQQEMRRRGKRTVVEAQETGVLFVPWDEVREEIPTELFGTYPLTAFLFGQYAAAYATMLTQRDIRSVRQKVVAREYAATARDPFAYLLFIQSIHHHSNLDGMSELTHSNGLVLGARYA